ncbi:hypothetical protein EA472_13930 [Natrarchaeobius oligotrophus]|uniref:Uncharacterized protein n=1 Tax=Natrarchaeobius chitinivorans TaxID=1679083 RepID=A0A3N6M7Y2_NATCH|nr:hypothetical protein EA472_13930 [Natrarchaeobius chitinivorans]
MTTRAGRCVDVVDRVVPSEPRSGVFPADGLGQGGYSSAAMAPATRSDLYPTVERIAMVTVETNRHVSDGRSAGTARAGGVRNGRSTAEERRPLAGLCTRRQFDAVARADGKTADETGVPVTAGYSSRRLIVFIIHNYLATCKAVALPRRTRHRRREPVSGGKNITDRTEGATNDVPVVSNPVT